MIKTGSVIKYQDNVDTDVIIPARYLTTGDPAELAKHCMGQKGRHHCRRLEFRQRLLP